MNAQIGTGFMAGMELANEIADQLLSRMKAVLIDETKDDEWKKGALMGFVLTLEPAIERVSAQLGV